MVAEMGGRERDGGVVRRDILGYGRVEGRKEVGQLEETEKIRRRLGGEVINEVHNTLGTVPNASLASALGKEYHPPILGTLWDHGGQVKIE